MRTVLTGVLACLAAACASPPPVWTLGGAPGEEGQRYGDFLAARYANLTADPAAAAEFYRRAFEREPTDALLLERSVVSALMAGDNKAAAAIAVKAGPAVLAEAPFATLVSVADDIARGRNRQALRRIDQGGLGAVNAYPAGALGAWLERGDDVDAAMNRLLAAGRPRDAQMQATAGLLLQARRKPAEALARLEAASLGGPLPAEAEAARIALSAHDDRAAAGRMAAEWRASQGYDPRVEAAGKGEAVEPLSARDGAAASLRMLGVGLLDNDNPELAALYLSVALHIAPELDAARIDLARALREQDRDDAALAALAQIDAGSAFAPQARMSAAFIQQGMGRDGEALVSAGVALARVRPRALVVQAGDLNRALERHAEAEALYAEAAKLDADEGREDWRVLFARAVERDRLGRWPEAEADLKRALELEPDRPELLNFLGYGWIERGGDVRAGLTLIERALAARPDQGYIVDSLGWAHYRLGDYDVAVAHLERAAELSPSDPDVNDHLGDAYWRTGRKREAEFQWRRALSQQPSEQLAAELRGKLDAGLPAETPPRAAEATPQRTNP